jgi:hypothetical protein
MWARQNPKREGGDGNLGIIDLGRENTILQR